MSHRVVAVYSDPDRARLAAGDLQSVGVLPENIAVGEGRVEVQARDADQAINVQVFLQTDGAEWAEVQRGIDHGPATAIPTVPVPAVPVPTPEPLR